VKDLVPAVLDDDLRQRDRHRELVRVHSGDRGFGAHVGQLRDERLCVQTGAVSPES